MKYLALLLLLPALAHAQRVTPCNNATPSNAVCIVWTASTTWTNGTPIVVPVTYRVEQRTGSGAWTTVTTVSQPQAYVVNLAPGTYTFRVFAIANSQVSDASNEAVKEATAPPPVIPTPPVIQVVQVIIGVDHAPVFTVLADGSRSNTVGGMVPVGTECTGPVIFRYRNKDWRKPVTFKPWGVSATARVAAPCA